MAFHRLLAASLAVTAVAAAGVLVFVLLGGGSPGDTRESSRASGTAAVDEQASLLVVDQQRAVHFTDGAFPYVRLESAEGEVVAERLLRDTRTVLPLLRQSVSPGAYRLVSYQRPCEGVCPSQGTRGLDPPTLRCEATVEIAPEQTLSALIRSHGARSCRIVVGERVSPGRARRQGVAACQRTADDRDHGLRYWARDWGAASTRPEDLGAAYAAREFRGFEPSIREAASEGCAEGIRTVTHPIRFLLDGPFSVGETIDVRITNVGTKPYLYEAFYQACFLSYFDSTGRRFIIPPGTHCDIRGKVGVRPGAIKRLFTWSLDECLKDAWGCIRSRPLSPGTYTIKGRFKSKDGRTPVQAEATFEIAGP